MGVTRAWWLDLNETLIRTGRVELADRLGEQEALERFAALCARAGEAGGLELVWLTGNTWEYARRVEEPLGLRLLPGVRWCVASENGLVARDGHGATLWRARPVGGWEARIEAWLAKWGAGARWTRQANEVRVTVKPIGNTFDATELASWRRGLTELEGWATPWLHPFYLDLDPVEVAWGDEVGPAPDKMWAARRLTSAGARVCAVGDSASDAGMLRAAVERGGRAWWVANAAPELGGAPRTAAGFTEGVVEALAEELRDV